jgi:hypothetical protein
MSRPTVEAEREATVLVVEVVKRHPQIGQDAVDTVDTVVAQKIFQEGKVAVYKCKPAVGDAVAVGVHVLVHAVEPARGPQARQQLAAVAAAAEGHVNIGAAGLDVEPRHALLQQCRNVIYLLVVVYVLCCHRLLRKYSIALSFRLVSRVRVINRL